PRRASGGNSARQADALQHEHRVHMKNRLHPAWKRFIKNSSLSREPPAIGTVITCIYNGHMALSEPNRGKRMALRILIVSNVRVVREGLNSVLTRQDGVDVVGTVDLPHAKDHSVQLRPEVILFDAGRQDAVELVKELVTCAPQSKVVAFGVRETEEDILALAAAGTAGYIRDNVKSGDVVGVLRQLLSDELTC